MHNKSYRYI